MTYRVVAPLLFILATLSLVGCDKATPVAPDGTALVVSANPSQISLTGTSTITIVGRRPDGNPLNPGTEIRLSSDIGTIDSIVAVDRTGTATATFHADGRSGPAKITAATGTGTVMANTTVQVGVGTGSKPIVLVSVTPSTIAPGGTATVTVVARNSDGTPVAQGQPVTLTTSQGTLKPQSPTIGANGTATATLTAGSREGTATITAIVGSSDAATTTATISFAPKPTLLISSSPNNIAVNDTSNITVIARNSDGSPVADGTVVTLTTNLGLITPSRPTTQGGVATATLQAGSQPGTATITGIVGTSDAVTTTVTIRDAASDISLQADSQTIPPSGGTITFSAFVINSQGQPLQGASVTFSSQVGTFANTGVVFTDTNGVATNKLTVTQAQLAGRTSFTVTAKTPGGNGQQLTATTTITVQ
ncbi:MAG TPA: invasin domain 3-containing protein [Thermoanaerobaculia bacterium]|jgi:hypothetical protein|nr:invasin domain 3-containing protein [Thermoanaerobaculia bacterium]